MPSTHSALQTAHVFGFEGPGRVCAIMHKMFAASSQLFMFRPAEGCASEAEGEAEDCASGAAEDAAISAGRDGAPGAEGSRRADVGAAPLLEVASAEATADDAEGRAKLLLPAPPPLVLFLLVRLLVLVLVLV